MEIYFLLLWGKSRVCVCPHLSFNPSPSTVNTLNPAPSPYSLMVESTTPCHTGASQLREGSQSHEMLSQASLQTHFDFVMLPRKWNLQGNTVTGYLCFPHGNDLRHVFCVHVRPAHAAKFIALSGACTRAKGEPFRLRDTCGACHAVGTMWRFHGRFILQVLLVLLAV